MMFASTNVATDVPMIIGAEMPKHCTFLINYLQKYT